MANVKNFSLVGEHGDFLDVVHCEPIKPDHEFMIESLNRVATPIFVSFFWSKPELGGAFDAPSNGLGLEVLINASTGMVHKFTFLPET